MSAARKIMEIVRRHNVLVIEDDPYGKLRFVGETVPHMKSMEQARSRWSTSARSPELLRRPTRGVAVCNGEDRTENRSGQAEQRYAYTKPQPVHRERLLPQWYARATYCRVLCTLRQKARLYAGDARQVFSAEHEVDASGGWYGFLWSELPEGYSSMRLLNYVLPARVAYVRAIPSLQTEEASARCV